MYFECKLWHLRRGGQKGFCDPIGAREPRLAECFDFPFDVIFDAVNRECGAIDQEYEANLPTMICANRLAPAVLFSIGCAGLPAATRRCCDPSAAATSEISPSHSPTGSGRMTRHSYEARTGTD